ncbi:MAG: outer membrane protein assembly factor BamA [Gammaproteobacteria bacterium]|nr:outer membrane protein assembly factor BamA [Gammaproteobacteria bacterium]MDG1234700.1 outer membrane protein assembly factor BamA [Pseudomonadales bacterium]MBT5152839.1 outer membrane protein assembly factor BamA [Gammaproteobacteria bacterium]MBT5683757.1 outer membrane protein assembly factor BamA [Gammaproteobacteria bacterium]MBT5722950.1 outer membrane protein assembly factor BamA [Gammaproteobacteria bacterium]
MVKLKDTLGKYARSLILLVTLSYCTSSFGFVISDIRVEGLQRVSAGTVFGAVPYSVGDNVGAEEVRTIARSLFQTETFDDVQVGRDGNVLVIIVKERPTIDTIEFEGNKAIKTEALIEGLQGSGLSEGQIFKKVTLDQIASDLERQYVSQGRYDANIETNIENLPRNRVAIKVDVYEGNVSGISHINIVGNTVFDDETLIELLELKLPGWLSFYTKDDQYSREKLQSDIEVLESHYLDRGYLNFRVDSTQVSIAPNMEDVYITVNVIEGDQFKISAVEVAGELRDIPEENIRAMLLTREGQTFSRQYMTLSEERIESALGNAGYTFASATGEPAANDDGETVTVKYFIDAGKRAYVRRLNFQGNTVTQDHVLRREMRQMEGGWASTAMIEGSKIRLQRLGFFKDVSVETPSVPGTDDQIDVNYTVEEQPSGSISATVGYAQRMGLILGLGYQESNVFGTGNSINIGINRSDYQQSLNVSFFDPYYTVDGVSRGYSAFFRKSDYEERNIASFSTDSYGLNVSFGYPISEISRIGLTVGIERTEIKEGVIPAQEISEFLDEEGNEFDLVSLTASYSMSALNRGLLPTAGRSQSMSFEMTVPGSELEYYRLNYTGQIFYPIFNPFVLRLRANLGYGEAYGDTENFPFYKHFFGGGMGSVRGYESNSLGPRSTPSPQDQYNDPDPIGGNVLVELSAEVLFPLPFIEDQSQLKSVLFFDAGNVFNTNCPDVSVYCLDLDEGELRYSAGIAVTWITGFAPISFALAFPINDKEGDESESFQFELGKTF